MAGWMRERAIKIRIAHLSGTAVADKHELEGGDALSCSFGHGVWFVVAGLRVL